MEMDVRIVEYTRGVENGIVIPVDWAVCTVMGKVPLESQCLRALRNQLNMDVIYFPFIHLQRRFIHTRATQMQETTHCVSIRTHFQVFRLHFNPSAPERMVNKKQETCLFCSFRCLIFIRILSVRGGRT